MLRARLKTVLAGALQATGATHRPAVAGLRQAPLIVGYHRVADSFEEAARVAIPALLTSAAMLERHLDWLGRRYALVSLDEMGGRLLRGERPGRMAAITFDDGYRDVYEVAFPILRRKGIPASAFVVTELVGTSRPLIHDRLYTLALRALAAWRDPADEMTRLLSGCGLEPPSPPRMAHAVRNPYEAMRLLFGRYAASDLNALLGGFETRFGADEEWCGALPMTWEMLREMRAAGMTIGSHTATHVLLTHESWQREREEIAGSRRTLEERLGGPIDHIAYPDGRFDVWTAIAASIAGYRFGYTTCAHRDARFPMLTLPRRSLWEKSCADAEGRFSPALLACHAAGLLGLRSECRPEHGARGRRPPAAGNGRGAAGAPERPPMTPESACP